MKKRLLSFALVLTMMVSLLAVMGPRTVYAETDYTVKFALPEEYVDVANFYRIRIAQESAKLLMEDTKEIITIDGTEYRICSATTSIKPTKDNTCFEVYLDFPTATNNMVSTQWYSDVEWQVGEDIVAVPQDWEKMKTAGYEGYIKFVATKCTATFDLNGGALTNEQIGTIEANSWKYDSETGCFTKAFINGTAYSTIISEWDGCSPAKAESTFNKWIPETGTLTAATTFTASYLDTPAAADFTYTAPSDLVYDGQGKVPTVQPKSGITGMGAVTVKYSTDGEMWTDEPVKNANTYLVAIDVAEGSSYTSATKLTDSSWTFTIAKADQAAPTGLAATAPSVKGASDGKITGVTDKMEYKSASASEYTAVTGTEITGLSEGTYKVRYAEDNNHKAGTDAEVTVSDVLTPVAGDFTFTAPSDLTYDGTAKAATVTTGKEGMGTITVKYFDKDGVQLTSTPVDAGTYTVKVDVAEGTKYAEAELTDSAWTFTIKPAKLQMTLSQNSFVYNGEEQAPEVTVTGVEGDVLTENDDYQVTIGQATRKNAGTYTVTVASFNDNYEAADPATYTILFKDVTDDTDYWYNPINWAAAEGITKGFADGSFGAEESCTRREIMIFIWRQMGCEEGTVKPEEYFEDWNLAKYPATSDTYKAASWGITKGITKGFARKDGEKTVYDFRADSSVTRKDAIIMIYRAAGKQPWSATRGEMKFTDVKGIYGETTDTYNAICWAYNNKITNGFSSGEYKGQFGCELTCLRKDILTFLYRYSMLN